jgi:hypothetical protein
MLGLNVLPALVSILDFVLAEALRKFGGRQCGNEQGGDNKRMPALDSCGISPSQ